MMWDSALIEHYFLIHDTWKEQYALASDVERWAILRKVYQFYMPYIMERSAQHLRGRIDPYFVNWRFTPIEEIAWQTIRALGTPLYPQVPVDRFFIDFANPYHKIGLELDGKDFHIQEEDYQRDCRLMHQGWKIFRVSGRQAYADSRLGNDEENNPEFWDTSYGVITAIDRVFFRNDPHHWRHFDSAVLALEEHHLAPFTVYSTEQRVRHNMLAALGRRHVVHDKATIEADDEYEEDC